MIFANKFTKQRKKSMQLFPMILCYAYRQKYSITVIRDAPSTTGSRCKDPQPNDRQSLGNPVQDGEKGANRIKYTIRKPTKSTDVG